MRSSLALALPILVVAACEARPVAAPARVDLAPPASSTAPSSTAPATASSSVDDAGAVASSDASPPPAAAALPWCTPTYTNTPCAFRAYGQCYQRFKNCTNLPCTESAPAPTRCPSGTAPAFMMAKAQSCGRRATDPVEPRTTGWASVPKECDSILTTWSNVPTDDRACKVDADCIDVVGSCFHATLNVTAKKKAAYAKTPCSAPGGGACADGAVPVRCESGCCVEMGGGFGFAETPMPAFP